MINSAPTIANETLAFHVGYVEGLTETQNRFYLNGPVTEADIVGVIRNLTEIAIEGWLTDELISHDAGLIAGWVSRSIFQTRGD